MGWSKWRFFRESFDAVEKIGFADDWPLKLRRPVLNEQGFNLSFYVFLLVLVSLCCGSAPGWSEPSFRSVMASVALVAGWTILCHTAARMMVLQVKRGHMRIRDASRMLEIQLDIFRWLGLPVVLTCLGAFSLAAWSREQPILESSMMLQSIVLLMPGITILLATWSAEHVFGARLGLTDSSLRNYFVSLWSGLRAGPVWLIIPTMLFLLLGDLAEWSQPIATGNAVAIGIGVGIAVIAFVLPWIVGRVIRQETMSTTDRESITLWLNRVGVKTEGWSAMRIVRWNTNGRVFNALVAGLFRPGRMLLLSDRVIDELPRGQLLMVVMHEVAHVRRWHVPIRMAAVAPAWFVSIWVGSLFTNESWGATVGGLTGLLLTVGTLSAVAYLTEWDADAVACKLAVKAGGQAEGMPATEAEAAGMMAAALGRVTAGHPAARRASWLHPSLAMRVKRLAKPPRMHLI